MPRTFTPVFPFPPSPGGTDLFQFNYFPVENGHMLAQLARHAVTWLRRSQLLEHPIALLALPGERLLGFCQRPSNRRYRSELMRFQPGHFVLTNCGSARSRSATTVACSRRPRNQTCGNARTTARHSGRFAPGAGTALETCSRADEIALYARIGGRPRRSTLSRCNKSKARNISWVSSGWLVRILAVSR